MSTSKDKKDQEDNQKDNTESPIVTNSQVTDEQLINWIKSRRSIGNLTIPAPTENQIKVAIDCAVTAPDHKKLQPWRFIITQGNARHELGRAFLAAAEAQEGETLSEKARQKTYNMPLRAPVIITVVTHMQAHKKVPPFEQMLSAGAAVQNLILALKAQGFSTVWRTGLLCNEPAVKDYFNVGPDDYVTAFVYTGSSPCDMPTRKPIDIEPLVHFE
ncbi:nitroreductase family protein [Psychrobacter sp. DAB_AL62B]|uniref:nitroreductase family protein n=1 Tax=Psychrobacter sp. DAB_AL62B TaxID=1028420 RepID=UPI002381784B|nr:nitroreductase [Psychrobacter sp. DAB_AL62B]MDE4453741.1 nitroreductase [Psychrobacter sp. DAB_AL62B]